MITVSLDLHLKDTQPVVMEMNGILKAWYIYFFDIIHFQIPSMVREMENVINQWLGERLRITEMVFHPYLVLSKFCDWGSLTSLYDVTASVAIKDAPLVIDKKHPHGGSSDDTEQSLEGVASFVGNVKAAMD